MGGGFAPVDWSQQYLTFKALENGTFKIGSATQYSLDKGATWTSLAANTNSPTVSSGSTIMWKGTLTPTTNNGVGTFSSTGNFDVMGNPLSLIFGDNFKNVDDLTGYTWCFGRLFRYCSKLYSAEYLSLCADTLVADCYRQMFGGCSNLTTPPQLPATVLAIECYMSMFEGCSKLAYAPELNAALAQFCYYQMFNGCSSLVTAPYLPATQYENQCYNQMFRGCSSLVNAPIMALTGNVGSYCCYQMFLNCTKLEIAPVIHATRLYGNLNCLREMFRGCSKLRYIKAMFVTTDNASNTASWVDGVASEGIFVKSIDATWSESGIVPTGWTVQTASE